MKLNWDNISYLFQVPLLWFREADRKLNIFSDGHGILVERNNPDGTLITTDPDALADLLSDAFVTLDTEQTIEGAKKFVSAITVEHPTEGRKSYVDRGAIELYHATPYIDFHYNLSTEDYTSRIIEVAAGILEIRSPDHARLGEHPTDTTLNASNTSGTARQIATVGYGNSHYWRKDNSSDGFLRNVSGTLSYVAFGTTSGTVAEGDHTHTTAGITDWATATANFLTSADLTNYVTSSSLATTLSGYSTSGHTHDLRYARLSHAHGHITSDGKLDNCTSNDCLVITTTGGVITHSNSGPKASDVASLVTQWINNSRQIGGGSITTSNITDWATATANFLTASSLSGYVTSSDLSSALADYADAETVGDLADIVGDIVDAYQDASDVSSAIQTALADYVSSSDLATTLADYVTDADLGEYLEESDFPNGFLTAAASGASGTITVVTGVTWNGTSLAYTKQTVTVSKGLVTSLGSSSSTTINTPTVVTWS